MINEDLLYYLWQTKRIQNPQTIDGRTIEIIDYGYRNDRSGPDFLNAKIKIDGIVWAGNVEMHVRSVDWLSHNHHHDKAYHNVILHVVYQHDREIYFSTSIDIDIPTIEAKLWVNPLILRTYYNFYENKKEIPCEASLDDWLREKLKLSLPGLAMQKLEGKVNALDLIYKKSNGDLEQTLFVLVSKYFGGTTNAAVFEQLAHNVKLAIIKKNRYDFIRVDSLLFGSAGLLSTDSFVDDYYTLLQKEYLVQKAKYQFVEMDAVNWKYGKMLPSGFTTIRLAQLSALFSNDISVVDRILSSTTVEDIREIFKTEPNIYWETHYVFGKKCKKKSTRFTSEFCDRIIINAIAPFLFFYGTNRGEQQYKDFAVELLDQIKAEKNVAIDHWKSLGMKATTALDSQALLHLKNNYCKCFKCLSCSVGQSLMKIAEQ